MKNELEVLSTPMIEQHLNRNPRVTGYCGNDLLIVAYDSAIPVPPCIAYEARQLGLTELAMLPHFCFAVRIEGTSNDAEPATSGQEN